METKHKKNRTWADGEKESHREQYGTQILIENGTIPFNKIQLCIVF